MNKKDLWRLIGYSVLYFILLSAWALWFSNLHRGYYRAHEEEYQLSQQKFEQFVEKVKSGEVQPTTDKWIEILTEERKAGESEYQMIVPLTDGLQHIGWFSLIFAGCNVLIILYVRDDIKKRQRT